MLSEINNERRTRWATKATVLGTARIMTFEDLEKARAEHASKEAKKAEAKAKRIEKAAKKAAKEVDVTARATPGVEGMTAVKKKRGRQRKSAAPDEEVDGREPRAKVARTSEVQVEAEIFAESHRAPEARMY